MPSSYALPDFMPSIAVTLIDALAGAKIGFCVMVDDGAQPQTIYQNEVAAEIMGYPLEEMLGRDPFRFIAPEEVPRLLERRQRAMRREAMPPTIDTIIVRKDGTRVPVEIGTSRVKIDGRDAIVAFLRDVSERVRAEHAQEALRVSEERFRRLIEAVPEAIGVAKEGRLVYVNPALVRLLGYDSPDDLVGRSMLDFVVPEDIASLRARASNVDPETRLPSHEYRVVRRDGSHTTIEAYSIGVDFEGGPAILGVSRDITERKRLTEQMLHSDRMAIVGTLAAGVAHEINNPLAYISLILERLRREIPKVPEDPTRITDLMAIIDEARGGADRVATIVRDLRMFSRDHDGVSLTDVRRVLESSIKIAENEIRHRARLVVEAPPLPFIEASEARLGQVFLNLLVNAVQAIPDGDPEHNEVRVSVRYDAERVHIDVADTGAGIAPEIRTRIFEPFFTTKAVGVGTGLGLSICQSIVASMGGTIGVESAVGRGTTFRVSLPRGKPKAASMAAPPAAAAQPRGARVLVIDDEAPLGMALRNELEDEYDVTLATSGRAGLEKLLTESYDAVLCDVMMPDLSGLDLHEELALKKPSAAARMIFMTGGAFTPRTRAFFERDDIRRIEKPFDRNELRSAIRGLVGRKS